MGNGKKIFQFLSSVLFYSVVLILVVIFLMVAAYFIDQRIGLKNGEKRSPLFGAYVIISESMIPSINVYDAVVTMRANESQIEVDDIITFLSKEIQTAGTPITHRVIGIVYDEKEEKVIGYRTKGDANNTEDFALIAPNEVIGKVVFRIPMIGHLQTIMTKPIGWILIVVLPCLLIIGNDVYKIVVKTKKDEDGSDNVIAEVVSETYSIDPVPIKPVEVNNSINSEGVVDVSVKSQSVVNNITSTSDIPHVTSNNVVINDVSDSNSDNLI